MKPASVLIGIFLSCLSLFLSAPGVYAFGGCEENCQKCHSLEMDEARQILKDIKAKDVNVTAIKMSPVKGLWELSIEDSKGDRGVLYVGFSKKYIVGGPIVPIDSSSLKTSEAPNQVNKDKYIDISGVPLDDALLVGDRKAAIKVVVFTDPD